MPKVLLLAAALAGPTMAQAGLSEDLQRAKRDEGSCSWVQTYTETRIGLCTLSNGDMLVVPARPISKAVALDLMATAAVAAEMNKRSPMSLSVALSPALDTFIRVSGRPVRFNGLEGRSAAMRALSRAAVSCKMKKFEEVCSDGTTSKLTPIN